MAKHSKTWWGQKFIGALESFTDSGRLQRGRSYAGDSRILSFDITKGIVTAIVRGNVNPYFGVYKEPKYHTEVAMAKIAAKDWSTIIQHMSSKASVVARLLLNEVPENIEDSFVEVGQSLLPRSRKDLKTDCSCPDFSNPCKHIAGLCYRLAGELDHDPFLLFELRGLSKEALQTELAKSPLGKALASELDEHALELKPSTSYFTKPETSLCAEVPTLKQFWQGHKRLPQAIPFSPPSSVSAIAIKKQGDNPPFWQKDSSFIGTMEELYERVKTKNSALL
ncbi:SWIM zinc finger family protein [Tumidithrix elongata RA019]|uniref:SWIM zinc finger family protein n=1 Tax=Tumidithrix elongata BACA0141 TaxID=2716417 RepID=A0AAW9PXW0_9CYAN|nr:SWIM zinc finger family protein [Tumidithrix elongata RA019]